jgi:type I restriction enzyme S subunit
MAERKETELGQLPAGWDLRTVDEVKSADRKSIISGPFGSNISSKFFVPDGIPVIRGNNLSLDVSKRFIDDGFVFLTPDKANELGTWAIKDDLIFTAAGTIGQVGILAGSEKYSKYIISNKQLRVRLDRTIVEPLFAYYWFASPFMTNTVIGRDTGSTIPLINLSVLKGLPIPLPPLPEQQAIAEVLSSLDDKIDLLHRQNKTLEALAETLFRQWFVEEAEESWETKTISDVALINQSSVDKDYPFAEIEYLDTGSITDGTIAEYQYLKLSDAPSRARRIVKSADIVISLVRPIQRHYGILKTVNQNTIASTGFCVVSCVGIDPHFIYLLLTQKEMTEFLDAIAEGSTTAYPSLKPSDIAAIEFKMPPSELLEQFSAYASFAWKKIESNTKQIRTLTTLRDALLPKLMSGEMRVELSSTESATANQ